MTGTGREAGGLGQFPENPGEIRVLITLSDPGLIEYARNDLQSEGCFRVEVVPTGEEALGRLRMTGFDAIVSSMSLPGMSGTELLRQLRDAHRDVQTVIITAHGSIETAVEAMQEGAFDYLTLAVGVVGFTAAYLLWTASVKKYKSTGS
jgi:DNA-binding NtrC family response regulator